MTDHITTRHLYWAAQECEWQQSGELSVAWMLDGWHYARGFPPDQIDARFIQRLAQIVEPRHNTGKFRTVDVRVGWSVKMPHRHVPAAMDQWVTSLPKMSPTEAFREYEEIHPFRDGNGRTGAIIFQMLGQTMDRPVHVPNLWNDLMRYEGEIRTERPA